MHGKGVQNRQVRLSLNTVLTEGTESDIGRLVVQKIRYVRNKAIMTK